MRTSVAILFVCLIATVGSAVAHQGVHNAAVMARMDGMKSMAETMKLLGAMAKGERAFDPEVARAATRSIAHQAAEVPPLFEAQELDPKSEARSTIWENYDDYSVKAGELEDVALRLSVSISSETDLASAIAELGSACKTCHAQYRK